MQTLSLVATGDDYTKAAMLVDTSAERIKYKVANQPVIAQFMPVNPHGGEGEWTPASGFLITEEDNTYSNVCGVRFKSAIPGTPALVLAQSYAPGDPVPEGGVAFLASLSAQGQTGTSVLIPVVTLANFPPAGPSDGQVVLLELPASYDPIGGKKLRWLCTYDEADAVWIVDAPPLRAEVATGEITSSTSYVGLTTPLTLVLPRPGDYDVESGCLVASTVSATALEPYQSYDVGGAGAIDTDAARGGMVANGSGWNGTIRRTSRKSGIGAVTLTAKYKETHGSGANLTFSNRYLAALPLRIT